MKISINVDCTPEEARRFLGLPDVGPFQQRVLQEMEDQMASSLSAMQPTELMKLWFPTNLDGWQQLQRSFWQQFSAPQQRGDESA